MLFLDNLANFQPKLMILTQEPPPILSNLVELTQAQEPKRALTQCLADSNNNDNI